MIGIQVGLLGIIALLLTCALSPLGPWLHLKKLEWQVKRNVDPVELQQWAMNLLAQHPYEHWENYFGKSLDDGTNFPSGLNKVGCFNPIMKVLARDGEVAIFCDSKGGPFLVVGPPSLVKNFPTGILWKPGIYFVGIRRSIRFPE